MPSELLVLRVLYTETKHGPGLGIEVHPGEAVQAIEDGMEEEEADRVALGTLHLVAQWVADKLGERSGSRPATLGDVL